RPAATGRLRVLSLEHALRRTAAPGDRGGAFDRRARDRRGARDRRSLCHDGENFLTASAHTRNDKQGAAPRSETDRAVFASEIPLIVERGESPRLGERIERDGLGG